MSHKVLFPLVLTFLSLTITKAQTFNGGLVLGMNATQIDGDNLAGYNNAGLVAGVYVFTEFSRNWRGLMEIKYSGKGAGTKKDNPNILKIRLNYVDVPFVASYTPVENLWLEMGLSANYYFKGRIYQDGWNDLDEEPNPFDLMWLAGINYQLLLNMSIGARYSYSLMPVAGENSLTTPWWVTPWHNDVVTFSLYFNILDRQRF